MLTPLEHAKYYNYGEPFVPRKEQAYEHNRLRS